MIDQATRIKELEDRVETLEKELKETKDKLGRKRKVTDEDITKMKILRKQGRTFQEISDSLNIAKTTVYYYLKTDTKQ